MNAFISLNQVWFYGQFSLLQMFTIFKVYILNILENPLDFVSMFFSSPCSSSSSSSTSISSFYSFSQTMFKTKIANGSQVANRQKLKFVSVFSIAFSSPEQKWIPNGNLSKCETNHVMKSIYFFFLFFSSAFLLFSALHVSQSNQV